MFGGWRGLGVAWAIAAVVAAGAAGALQWAGPPRPPRATAEAARPPAAASHVAAAHAPSSPPPPAAAEGHGDRHAETAPAVPAAHDEPHVPAPAPSAVPAAPPPIGDRPRLALLLSGMGLSEAESRAAITALPPGVTLGVSPYASDPAGVAAEAKRRGDEVLVTLPMESQGYPLNDSGPHALLTGAAPGENAQNLDWVLDRLPDATGATGASDGLHGERFANAPSAFEPVLNELAGRHLLYVDPRPGAAVGAGAVAVTTVLDDPPLRADIEARLTELEQLARDGKPALGLADSPRPVTVEVIANWARGLAGRGIALVPVSALMPDSAPPVARSTPH